MSVTPINNAQQVVVNYKSPAERATRDASTTALSFLIALGIVVTPLVISFLNAAVYSRSTFVALLSAIGVAALTTVINYLLVLQRAMGSDPVYQQQRAAALQADNTLRLQSRAMDLRALEIRYGVPAPVAPPPAASFAVMRNEHHAAQT